MRYGLTGRWAVDRHATAMARSSARVIQSRARIAARAAAAPGRNEPRKKARLASRKPSPPGVRNACISNVPETVGSYRTERTPFHECGSRFGDATEPLSR